MMTFRLEDSIIAFAGFRTTPIADVESFLEDLNKLSEITSTEIVALAANSVYSWRVLLRATAAALRAFKRGRNIARKLSLEVMLNLSGSRQIREAIKECGLRKGASSIVILIIARDPSLCTKVHDLLVTKYKLVEDPSVLNPSSGKARAMILKLGISEKAIKASRINGDESLEELVEKFLLSRIAMLELQR